MRQRSLITQPREGLTDNELTGRAAGGEVAAFEELYRRHADAAWRVAQAVTGNPHDAADAVSDAFTRVFQALPTRLKDGDHFRPYLLACTRNAAIDVLRRNGRLSPTESEQLDRPAIGNEPAELLVGDIDSSLVTRAFRSLPERWRSVLWLTEVEGIPPREAADMLGLSPNGVAQLAVRARTGLRERFLQAHLGDVEVLAECRYSVDRLGAYVAGGLAPRDVAKVDQHLAGCSACTDRQAELAEIEPSLLRRAALPLPAGLAALVLGRWELAGTGAAVAAGAGGSAGVAAGAGIAGGGLAAVAGSTAVGVGGLAAVVATPVGATVASVALFVAAVVGVGAMTPDTNRPPEPAPVVVAADLSEPRGSLVPSAASPVIVPEDPAPEPAPVPAAEPAPQVTRVIVTLPRAPRPVGAGSASGSVGAVAPTVAEVVETVTRNTPALAELGEVGVTLGLGVVDVVLSLGQASPSCAGISIAGITIGCTPGTAQRPAVLTISTGGLVPDVEVMLPDLPAILAGGPTVEMVTGLLAPLVDVLANLPPLPPTPVAAPGDPPVTGPGPGLLQGPGLHPALP